MIGAGPDPRPLQQLGALQRRVLQGDVDDGGRRGIAPQLLTEPIVAGVAGQRDNAQIQIGAVEAGHHQILLVDAELGLHVRHDRRGSGGGEQQHLGNIQLAAMGR
ncbi:hypothetical protein D3C79_970490 [compost metagenome]